MTPCTFESSPGRDKARSFGDAMTPGTQRTFSGEVGSGAAGPGAYQTAINMQHRPSAVRVCFIDPALVRSADSTKAEWAGQQPQNVFTLDTQSLWSAQTV